MQNYRNLITQYRENICSYSFRSSWTTSCVSQTALNTSRKHAHSISDVIKSARTRNCASVFSTQLIAILYSSSCLNLNPPNEYLLLSNSLSSLHALQDLYSTNPLIQRILLSSHLFIPILLLLPLPGYQTTYRSPAARGSEPQNR